MGPIGVESVSESLEKLNLYGPESYRLFGRKYLKMCENQDFSAEKPKFEGMSKPQTPKILDHQNATLLKGVVNGPDQVPDQKNSILVNRNSDFAETGRLGQNQAVCDHLNAPKPLSQDPAMVMKVDATDGVSVVNKGSSLTLTEAKSCDLKVDCIENEGRSPTPPAVLLNGIEAKYSDNSDVLPENLTKLA